MRKSTPDRYLKIPETLRVEMYYSSGVGLSENYLTKDDLLACDWYVKRFDEC